ncbi:hypothetical protein B4U32_12045, partial [Klebsiella pneumoniae]
MPVSGHIAIQKSKNSNNELSRWATNAPTAKETACNVNRPRSAQTSSAVFCARTALNRRVSS